LKKLFCKVPKFYLFETINFLNLMSKPEEEAKMGLYGCAVLGVWKLTQVTGYVTYGFWKHYTGPRHNILRRYGPKDSSIVPWAVVTGGACRIGKAHCLQLADAGCNLSVLDKDCNGLAGL
jgi:hypothetical protein